MITYHILSLILTHRSLHVSTMMPKASASINESMCKWVLATQKIVDKRYLSTPEPENEQKKSESDR